MIDEVAVRRGREGSRWYNQRPGSDEVAEWFRSVPLHDGMQHQDFIGGLTLIPANEKSNEITGFDNDGLPLIRERQDLVFVPYVKVETRVAYFWKLVGINDGWIGSIEPIKATGDSLGLPSGFFKYAAADPKGKTVSFVGCSMRVAVMDGDGRPVMTPPPGTKIVATATKWDVDQNSLMKAETGAVGRALGMAGMLVVPGSGVATAEDMIDASVPAGAAGAPEPPAEGAQQRSDDELREQLTRELEELQTLSPTRHAAFQEWARGRKLTIDSAHGPVLRGAVRKIERELDAARQENVARPEAPDAE